MQIRNRATDVHTVADTFVGRFSALAKLYARYMLLAEALAQNIAATDDAYRTIASSLLNSYARVICSNIVVVVVVSRTFMSRNDVT